MMLIMCHAISVAVQALIIIIDHADGQYFKLMLDSFS
jgi:hypothetical protein